MRSLRLLMCAVALLAAGTAARGQASTVNYAFSVSNTGSLSLDRHGNTVDMSTGTTQLVGPSNDNVSSPLNSIGFPFLFMGTSYSQFSASANGLVRLGTTTVGTATYAFGQANQPLIAPFTGDLETSSAGKVHYKVVGTAPNRTLVVEFLNMGIDYTGTYTNLDATYQLRLYETSGIIEYVYGKMFRNSSTITTGGNLNIGFSTSNVANSVVSVNSATSALNYTTPITTNTYTTNANIPNLNSTADGSRTVYTFIPPVASAPAGMTFTSVGHSSMTVNWMDNSTNELNFAVYRSTDNITFAPVGTVASTTQTGTGTTYTLAQTGLNSTTTYFYRVVALTEGAESAPLTGSQATAAGTICGTKIVGPSAGANYPSITAAIADIAANGLACGIMIELQPAYVSSVETFPLAIPSLGNNASTPIIIRPQAGATNLSITSAATQTIVFNGARFITIDGRAGGGGSSRALTIENTSTTGSAVQFINGGSNNMITYTNIKGVTTSSTSGVIAFSTSTGSTGNSGNTISHNMIGDGATTPTNIIYSAGSAGLENANNAVADNEIFNFYNASAASNGITLQANNNAWNISNNSFFQSSTRTATAGATHSAILINNTGSGYVINGNFIGGSGAFISGSPMTYTGTFANRFIGINLVGMGAAVPASIQGNTVAGIQVTTTSGATALPGVFSGISLQNGNADIGTVTGNTVGSTLAPIVVQVTSTSGGNIFGIASSSTGIVNIVNNGVNNIQVSNVTSPSTIRANLVGIHAVNGTITISRNTAGHASAPFGLINQTGSTAISGTHFLIGINASGTLTVTENNVSRIIYSGGSTVASVTGISLNSGTLTVLRNSISNIISSAPNPGAAAAASVMGLYLNSTIAPAIVTQNVLTGIGNTATSANVSVTGMYLAGTASTGNTYNRNSVSAVYAANSGTATLSGIVSAAGAGTFSNNMVDLGLDATSTAMTAAHSITGILKSSTGNNNFFYNTIRIQGAGVASTASNTYAFRRTAAATDSIVNNILANMRVNASTGGNHYAIGLDATTTLVSNYNDLYTTGAVLGAAGTTDYATLTAWKAGTSLDANSISVAPNFVSATDLHIITTTATLLESSGMVIPDITIDYDNNVRPGPAGSVNGGGTAPDIGADEFDGIPVTPCTGTPSTGTISGPSSLCEGSGTLLSLTGAPGEDGISFTWKVSSSAGGPYTSMGTAMTQNTGALTSNAYYVVTVSCSHSGLSATSAEHAITVNPLPVVTVTPASSVICLPAATAVPLTATGAVSYTWTPATGLSATTGASVTALPARTTTYTVTGTSANGCTASASSTVNVSALPAANATAAPSIVCPGGTSQLNVTAAADDYSMSTIAHDTITPVGAATIASWANSGADDGSAAAALPFAFNFYGNNYSQVFIGTNGYISFTSLASFTGAQLRTVQAFPAATTGPNNLIALAMSDLNQVAPAITRYFTTGTAPNRIFVVDFTTVPFYSAGTGSTGSVSGQIHLYETTNVVEVHLTNLSRGTATFGVTLGIENANGTLGQAPAGRSVSTATVSTPEAYRWTPLTRTYAWSPASFLSNTAIANPVASGVTATTPFSVTVTTSVGCSATSSPVTVTIDTLTSVSASASASTVCAGTSVTLTATHTGGRAPFTYSWSSGSTASTASVTPTTTSTYTVSVTDSCGITKSNTVTINVNPLPAITVTPSMASVCAGDSVFLTATGAASYTWAATAGLNTATGATVKASPSATTTYTVTGVDGNGCSNTTAVTVTVNPLPVASATSTNVTCFGLADGTATASATGGSGPYTYMWSNMQATASATGLAPGTYTVVATDANGCSDDATVTITEPPVLTASVSASANVTCNLGSDGSATTAATGGPSGTYTYSWSNGQSTATATGLTAGSYTVTVTDGSCTATATATITEPAAIAGSVTVTDVSCNGLTDGEATVTATGGPTGTFTYSWSTSPVQTTATATGLGAGTYTVTITDGACTGTATATITQPSAVSVMMMSTNVSCDGGNDGSAMAMTMGGPSAIYTYSWSDGQATQTASNLTAGNYTVTVTSGTCTGTATVSITEPAALSLSVSSTPASCNPGNDGTATVMASGGTGGYTYLWSNGETTSTAAGLAPGSYTVNVSYGSCAPSTATVLVNSTGGPVITTSNDTTICAGESVTLFATGGSTYSWDNGAGNTDTVIVSPASTTMYTVTVSDVNGCSTLDVVTVTVTQLPAAAFTYAFGNPAAIVNFTNASTDAAAYTWDFGDGSAADNSQDPSYTYTADGTYTVTLVSSNSCGSDTATEVITVIVSGIEDASAAVLKVNPNPSEGVFYITVDNAGISSMRMEVLDVHGKLVMSENESNMSSSYTKQIDLTSFAKGIYYLKLDTGSKVITKRIIVQ